MCGFLIAAASCHDTGSRCTGVGGADGLKASGGTWDLPCDQGSNPRPLHWQEDFYCCHWEALELNFLCYFE